MILPLSFRRRFPEIALTGLVLAGLGHTLNRFLVDGRLPQPFIFDVWDTFMDWFNTAYWAHNPGAFDVWRTVYPPLSFDFLRMFTTERCYRFDPLSARECDIYGIVSIIAWYVACVLIAAYAFHKRNAETAALRAISFGFGLPLIFTLERGNLIIPCFVFFVLAHSDIAKSRWIRALSAAISINFKPYLLLTVVSWALHRKWRLLELAGIATVLVYFLSLAAFADGTLTQMVANTANWVSFTSGFAYEGIYYSTSFTPFLEFNTHRFPTRSFIDTRIVDLIATGVPIITTASLALGIVTMAAVWLQPDAVTRTRTSAVLLAFYLVQASPGGYTATFLVFLVFMEPWRRPGPIIAIVMAYLLCVPYDYVLTNFLRLSGDRSWLSGRQVSTDFGIGVGMFARPGMIVILFWALALDTLMQVRRAHRHLKPVLALRPLSPRQAG